MVLDNDKRFETFRDETKNVDSAGNAYEPGQELMNINYNAAGDMLQVIASSAPQASSQRGFRGIAYYTNMELDYTGYYKIDEVYDVVQKPTTPPPNPGNLPMIK